MTTAAGSDKDTPRYDVGYYRERLERQHADRSRFWRVFWTGGALKFVIGDLALVLLYLYVWPPVAAPATPADRLVYVLHWQLLPALLFVANIYAVVFARTFYTRAAYDPASSHVVGDESWGILVNNRVLLNLIENYIPFLIAIVCTALYLDDRSIFNFRIIPCFVVMWTFGRMIYWVGYWWNPWYRVPGFVMSLHFTLYLIGYCLYRLATA